MLVTTAPARKVKGGSGHGDALRPYWWRPYQVRYVRQVSVPIAARDHSNDLFACGEGLKPQRQDRTEPGRMRRVVGQIVAGFRMQQHDQVIAIEHQPRHERRKHLGGKSNLKHRLGMRSDQFVVPAAKLGFWKVLGDTFA